MKSQYLNTLKEHILTIANIHQLATADCWMLSVTISEKTGMRVSEVTLQRLFGFTESKFEPSLFVLTTLAIFCGFPSWEVFCTYADSVITSGRPVPEVISDALTLAVLDTPTPLVILAVNTPDFTILAYNKAFEQATYTGQRHIRGLTWWQAFSPENAGGYGPTVLLEAFHEAIYTQQPVQPEPLHYNIPSALPVVTELSWWDVKVVPVRYDAQVKYLLLHMHNVTDKILHQDAIEQAILKELTGAEELAVTNVKLNNAIERLSESHQELFQTRKQLEEWVFERTKKLFDSEDRQRKLIDHAPVAIAVLKGPQHRVETANKRVTEYWGKGPDVVGKPLVEVLPEMEEQGFVEILNEVRRTGIAYVNPELRALINFDGVIQPRYFDMIYQPMQHEAGVTDSIFIVAFDITEQVTARKKLETSESLLRLAISAANIGTWSVNLQTRVVSYNGMFAKIIGWNKDRPLTFEDGMAQVTKGMREGLEAAIANSIANQEGLDFVYEQTRFDDGRRIWLNSIGSLAVNDAGEPVLSGVVKEIPGPR